MQSLHTRVEVAVIGGGFAGAAAAYYLGRAGVDVLILERERACGYHASGRNAALCRQLTESDAFTEYTVRGATFLRQPPADFADRSLLAKTGSILLAPSEEERHRLVHRAARWGLPIELVDAAAVMHRWPLLRGVKTAGGAFFPTDGVIDIHALLHGFLAGARRARARVELNCEVREVRSSSDEARIATSRGSIAARCVVIAAGAWAGELGGRAGANAPRFTPILRHLHLSKPVRDIDRLAPFVWNLGKDEFYVRPEGQGLLVSGCDETEVAPADAHVAPGALEGLAAKLARVAPRLAELKIARSWSCLRTFGPDPGPIVAWDKTIPWLFWVAGLGGHGATASPAIGETAAARICDRLRAWPKRLWRARPTASTK